MQRRRVLIGTGSVFTALIAGCSGEGGDTESTESDSSETETGTDSSGVDTSTQLAEAATDIQNAKDELEAESTKFTDSSVSSTEGINIETTTTENYLDDASAKLDDAEAGATETQQQSIDAARDWISFARETVVLLELLADGYSQMNTGTTYWDSDRYADATDAFETAEDNFREADSQLTIVEDRQSNLREAESEAFSDVDLTSVGREASIEELSGVLTTLIPLSDGFSKLSLGFEDYTAGTEDVENEDYIAAESAYEDAEAHFTSAESTLQGAEDSAPNSLRDTVIELSCYATGLKESAGHFAAAAGYLEAGNDQAAEEEVDQAQSALDGCNFEV